jgi:hypothetical protein
MARIHRHVCPACGATHRCPQRPSTYCTDPDATHCERCAATVRSQDHCAFRAPGPIPQLSGPRCDRRSVMFDFFRVRRWATRDGRRVESDGFELLGFCAEHAPESWRRAHSNRRDEVVEVGSK